MEALLLVLKVFCVAFGITAGIVALICGIYLMSCGVILFVEFVDRKIRKEE